jgi:hypothetical protein
VINESRLFDETYYQAVYGKCSPYKSALEHYIEESAGNFYAPSPFFPLLIIYRQMKILEKLKSTLFFIT